MVSASEGRLLQSSDPDVGFFNRWLFVLRKVMATLYDGIKQPNYITTLYELFRHLVTF